MSSARLNLVALRVLDIDRAAAFYRLLGLEFARHAHGDGPVHYASEADGFVFELYSTTAEQPASSAAARIGFSVENVDEVARRLAAFSGARLISAPRDSEWGRRAVVADPEAHRLELVQRIL